MNQVKEPIRGRLNSGNEMRYRIRPLCDIKTLSLSPQIAAVYCINKFSNKVFQLQGDVGKGNFLQVSAN